MQSLVPLLGYSVTALVVLSLLANLLLVKLFTRSRKNPPKPAIHNRPPVLVGMPLRGDSDASEAVKSVLAQTHEKFQLNVIVDSLADRVSLSARQASAGDPKCQIQELNDRLDSCSLVCNAQVQALDVQPPFEGVVAFAAGDTIWHPQWLTLLLDGLAEPEVGATLGNRWYVSEESGWGALTRRHWNAAATVAMWWLKIPWAGAMAIKSDVLEQCGVIDIWKHSMVEDVSVVASLRGHDWKFREVPDCVAVEVGELTFSEAAEFIARQDLWARLYHPYWPVVLTHAVLGIATLILPVVLVIAATLTASLFWLVGGALLLFIYIALLFVLVLMLEKDMNQTIERTGQQRQKWSFRTVFRSLLAIPLAQLVHGYVSIRAQFANKVVWSGVHYDIDGPFDVTLTGDEKRP